MTIAEFSLRVLKLLSEKLTISLRSISPLPFSSENTTSPLLEDITPPTLQNQNHEFTQWNALLTLKGDVLIQVIHGKQLKVSFQSSD